MAKSKPPGIGFGSLLFLLFLTLKLTGVIAWSWWWVTAPLWGGIALLAVTFLVMALAGGSFALIAALLKRSANVRAAKRAIG